MTPLRPRDWTRQPPALTPGYKSTVSRSPRLPLLSIEPGRTELSGPVFRPDLFGPHDADLLSNHGEGEPIGERILVHGRVLDEDGRGLAGALVEMWQANAGGRYRHVKDGYLAPLDPNFGGCGRALTDGDGGYAFLTVRPGPYPWPNFRNSWRPAHIHFSLFGASFAQRLITQMYFEGDPLIPHDPIANAVADPDALAALIAPLDLDATKPHDRLAYRFDIVLRGRRATWFENRED